MSGSARVSVPKFVIDQDSIYSEVEVALQDEPAWQVCVAGISADSTLSKSGSVLGESSHHLQQSCM